MYLTQACSYELAVSHYSFEPHIYEAEELALSHSAAIYNYRLIILSKRHPFMDRGVIG